MNAITGSLGRFAALSLLLASLVVACEQTPSANNMPFSLDAVDTGSEAGSASSSTDPDGADPPAAGATEGNTSSDAAVPPPQDGSESPADPGSSTDPEPGTPTDSGAGSDPGSGGSCLDDDHNCPAFAAVGSCTHPERVEFMRLHCCASCAALPAGDACPSDPDKVAPGLCGCGRRDLDSDDDGTPDCRDACPGDPDKLEPGTCGCFVPEGCAPGEEADPPALELDKTHFAVQETVMVHAVNLLGGTLDWIGMFKAGSPDTDFIEYIFTGSARSGNIRFSGLNAGAYEVRLFVGGEKRVADRVSFTVGP